METHRTVGLLGLLEDIRRRRRSRQRDVEEDRQPQRNDAPHQLFLSTNEVPCGRELSVAHALSAVKEFHAN